MSQVLFLIFSMLAIMGSILMILQKRVITAAGLLLVVMLSIGGLFLLIDAVFLALIQFGVALFLTFAVFIVVSSMDSEQAVEIPNYNSFQNWVTVGLIVLFMLVLSGQIVSMQFTLKIPGRFAMEIAGGSEPGYIAELIFNRYIIPLQLVGLLALVGIVGSIQTFSRCNDGSEDRN